MSLSVFRIQAGNAIITNMSYRQENNPLTKRSESWIGSSSGKQRSVNPVPLSTASTAAPSPRVAATQSPPPGFSEPVNGAPILNTPSGTFVNECPPSPGLTKRLLGQAQARKRAGRHNLVSVQGSSAGQTNRRVLRLSVAHPTPPAENQPIDRWGIPDDVYTSLLSSASLVKKCSGQHLIERRRRGLSGVVEPLLVIQSSSSRSLRHQPSFPPTCTVSLFSPDPSLF